MTDLPQQSFIFIGRSGCGKGTQAKLLSGYLKKTDPKREVLYIQSGAEFREFIKGESETQKLSKAIYDVGGIQPEFLAAFMWTNILVKKYTKNEHLIFDGTPRRYHEAGVLNSIFGFYNLKELHVINIEISNKESVKRLLARGRIDDTQEEIEKRLSWYGEEVGPAIGYFRNNKNYNFVAVNGEQSVEKIHEDLIKAIDLS